MNLEAKRAYIKAVKERYNNSTKSQKTSILNELCLTLGYSRKHAIRCLKCSKVLSFKKRPGAPRKYSSAARSRLVELWLLMHSPCSVNLKQALTLWLPYDLETPEKIKQELLAMGASTIERSLKDAKKIRDKGLSATRRSHFKSTIPLKLCKDQDKKALGYFEADTVAHCGNSLAGSHLWSLTMTDLFSGWTENRACLDKSAKSIRQAVHSIKEGLPFELMGFSSDNGSEFLNQTLQDYLQGVEVSRGRPYKKNDNAHVEQKNFTHVRRLLGYERLEGEHIMKLVNEIYKDYWNPLKNFFTPSLKLKQKQRVGGKIIKKYGVPRTPFERVIESGQITMKQQDLLLEKKYQLNPFKLQRKLNEKMEELYELIDETRREFKQVA